MTNNGEVGKMNDNEAKSKKQNLSFSRAMTILENMTSYRKPARLLDIAKDTGLTSSTVYRFLNAFIECGYVKRNEDSQTYTLTLKLAGLGHLCRQNYQITGNMQSYVEKISNHFQESASLCVEDNMQVVYVATHEGPNRMLSTLSRIGKVAPMHCTGTGKILLTEYSDEMLEELVVKKGLTRYTNKTICTLKDLKETLNTIREQGYAWDDEECELGAKCLAVPVRDYTNRIVASLSISCPIQRFPEIEPAIRFMKDISLKASQDLGYMGNRQT